MATLPVPTYASDPPTQAQANTNATTMVGYTQAVRAEMILALTSIRAAVVACMNNHPVPPPGTQNYNQVLAQIDASIVVFT